MAPPSPIGMRIKRARERLRITQAQLGEKLGVSQKTVDNWENGRTYPRSSIGALEDVLGASIGEPPGAAVELPAALLGHLDRLDPEQRAYVIELLSRRAEDECEPEADPGAA